MAELSLYTLNKLINEKLNDYSLIGHTHSKNDIVDLDSLKNPYSLTINLNNNNSISYDGSEQKTITINSTNIGAATNDHEHQTYINSISLDNNILKITHVNNTIDNITLPTNEQIKYDVFTGADNNKAGTSGLVPAPPQTCQNYVLTGSGNWSNELNVFSINSNSISENGKQLSEIYSNINHTHDNYLPLVDGGTITSSVGESSLQISSNRIIINGEETLTINGSGISSTGNSEITGFYRISTEYLNVSDSVNINGNLNLNGNTLYLGEDCYISCNSTKLSGLYINEEGIILYTNIDADNADINNIYNLYANNIYIKNIISNDVNKSNIITVGDSIDAKIDNLTANDTIETDILTTNYIKLSPTFHYISTKFFEISDGPNQGHYCFKFKINNYNNITYEKFIKYLENKKITIIDGYTQFIYNIDKNTMQQRTLSSENDGINDSTERGEINQLIAYTYNNVINYFAIIISAITITDIESIFTEGQTYINTYNILIDFVDYLFE